MWVQPLLFLHSIIKIHFKMWTWKRAEKLTWPTSIFSIHECSEQYLKTPLQDLSMQFHSTGCRHWVLQTWAHLVHRPIQAESQNGEIQFCSKSSHAKKHQETAIWLVSCIPLKRSSVHLYCKAHLACRTQMVCDWGWHGWLPEHTFQTELEGLPGKMKRLLTLNKK